MTDTQKRILIVEDEADLRESLRDVLIERGYYVATAENTELALKMLPDTNPDVILLDILTGSIHGSLFIQRMNDLASEHSHTKVIVLTNIDQEQMRNKFERLQVEAYMVKVDTSLQDIINKIEATLAS